MRPMLCRTKKTKQNQGRSKINFSFVAYIGYCSTCFIFRVFFSNVSDRIFLHEGDTYKVVSFVIGTAVINTPSDTAVMTFYCTRGGAESHFYFFLPVSLRRLGDLPDPHKQGLAGSWQAIASASGPLRWPFHYSTRYLLRGKGLQQVPRGAKARRSFNFREWGTEDEGRRQRDGG